MLGCKIADTLMESNYKIELKNDCAPVDKGRYQCLIGKLIYLSHTILNIGFSVSVKSQFMNNPKEEHLEAVYRLLKYLKMTPGKGLFFKKGNNREIKVYFDTD